MATGVWTLDAWAETLQRKGDQRAIVTSLELGAVCATISLLVGAPLAWRLSRSSHGFRSSWLSLLNVGANFGGIGLAFGFTAALGTYGMVTLLLNGAGIAFSPPSPASFLGLLLAYVYTNVPLFVLLTVPAMNVIRGEMDGGRARLRGDAAAVLAVGRAPGADAISGRRLAAHLHLVDRDLRSGLRAGRQRRHQPAAADDLTDRGRPQLGRQSARNEPP